MLSYVTQTLVEYFRNSTQFYYIIFGPSAEVLYTNPLFEKNKGLATLLPHDLIFETIQQCKLNPGRNVPIETILNDDAGTIIQWELSPIIDEAGKLEKFQAIGIHLKKSPVLFSDEAIERYRYQAAMLENVSDIIISCSLDHIVRSWNKKAESFYNIPASEAIGKKITDLVSIEYLTVSRKEAHEIFFREGTWRGEVSYEHHEGKKYLINTLNFVTSTKGERIGIMVIGKDITEQKIAEAALRQSELFYRNLTADSLDGILIANKEGLLRFASPSVTRILGYDPQDVIGRSAFEFVHPEDAQHAYNSFLNEVSEDPKVKYILVRLLRKNGDWLWCMVRGHNLLRTPNVSGVIIYFYDDSLRKKAEDALKESEERFRLLVKDLKMGVIMRDPEGKGILCNNAALDLMGLTQEEFLDSTLESNGMVFVTENFSELPLSLHPARVAAQTKLPVRDTTVGAFCKKTKLWYWLIINAEPILNAAGQLQHVVVTFIDITERKKLEQKLIDDEVQKHRVITKATIEAQEKERKEIGKELHDNIGQHLTTSKLYLEIARGSADEATLELISLATKSVSDVINEVRKLSRSVSPPTLGDLGLVESVKDLCESLEKTQTYTIRFFHEFFEEDLLAENIKLMLFRIIQEQVNNIIRHAEANTILIRLHSDSEQLVLVVTDNGKGFDPSVNKKGQGISNMINRAEVFNGKVTIASAEGNGCRLLVTVPL